MENKSISLEREEEYLKFLKNQESYGASKVYSLRLEKAEAAEIEKIDTIRQDYMNKINECISRIAELQK